METAETTEAKCRRLGIWITAEAVKELVIPMAGQISKCSNVPLAHFGKIVFQQSGRRHCIDSRDVGILEINVVDKGGLLESASPSYSQERPHIHQAEMRRLTPGPPRHVRAESNFLSVSCVLLFLQAAALLIFRKHLLIIQQ